MTFLTTHLDEKIKQFQRTLSRYTISSTLGLAPPPTTARTGRYQRVVTCRDFQYSLHFCNSAGMGPSVLPMPTTHLPRSKRETEVYLTLLHFAAPPRPLPRLKRETEGSRIFIWNSVLLFPNSESQQTVRTMVKDTCYNWMHLNQLISVHLNL
jgi:hypothetical protein